MTIKTISYTVLDGRLVSVDGSGYFGMTATQVYFLVLVVSVWRKTFYSILQAGSTSGSSSMPTSSSLSVVGSPDWVKNAWLLRAMYGHLYSSEQSLLGCSGLTGRGRGRTPIAPRC
jgi:hypothetical protein